MGIRVFAFISRLSGLMVSIDGTLIWLGFLHASLRMYVCIPSLVYSVLYRIPLVYDLVHRTHQDIHQGNIDTLLDTINNVTHSVYP